MSRATPFQTLFASLAAVLLLTGNTDRIVITTEHAGEIGVVVDGMDGSRKVNDKRYTIDEGGRELVLEPGFTASHGHDQSDILLIPNDPLFSATLISQAWTEGSDVATTHLEPKITLPVTIWLLYQPRSGAARERALEYLSALNDILAREYAGIDIDYRIVDRTGRSSLERFYRFDCTMRNDLQTSAGKDRDRMNIYLVETVDGATGDGQSCIGQLKGFVAVPFGARPHLMAHEIYHSLGNGHVSFNRKNVMYERSDLRLFLTEGQTFRAHVSTTSYINIKRMRPNQIPRQCGTRATDKVPSLSLKIWNDVEPPSQRAAAQ